MTRSPITNCWNNAHTRRVAAEHFTIFQAHPGAAYSHHPQITSLDGRLYATWSNGPVHEDQPGQRMLLSTSDDLGTTWSPPRPLVDVQPGEFGDGIVTGMGIYVHDDRMMAYYGYYDYTREGLAFFQESGCAQKHNTAVHFHQGSYTGVMISTDKGETWTGPVGRVERFVANLCPQRLSNGRLVMPGNESFPYTDDPAGIQGWHMTGLPRLPEDYVDDPEGFWGGQERRGDPFAMCEASLYETDDGVIHMMLRTSADPSFLAVSESFDGGVIYSEPVETDYTDCRCRHHFGRLPDGRYFGLSCPQQGSRRTPLVLATSRDGVRFDHHFILGDAPAEPARMSGFHKSGRYGYPSYHIVGDTMVVIYSIAKEDVAMARFKLSDLAE